MLTSVLYSSSGSVHCSRVTEILPRANTCLRGLNTLESESSFDEVSVREYVMRLFKTTIMVLEYIFPNTVEVVSKYPGSRHKIRLTIATVAVQIEDIIRLPSPDA
jgi:hypothetical protein